MCLSHKPCWNLQAGWNYVLREYTSRECEASKLDLPVAVLTDPAALSEHVPVCKTLREKLELPLHWVILQARGSAAPKRDLHSV